MRSLLLPYPTLFHFSSHNQLLDYIIMRNIRSKRIKTETITFFAGPFQDSVLEIELEKQLKCLTAIQKAQFDKASELLQQISIDLSVITLDNKQQNMLDFLIHSTRAYLWLKQGRYEEALKLLEELKPGKNREEKGGKMRNALSQLIRSTILCRLGQLEQSKIAIKNAFETIKADKDHQINHLQSKNIQKYNEIFIIFFDMIALELSKLAKFQQILSIYKQGYQLSKQILGKEHKLTSLMRRIIRQHSKDNSFTENSLSSNGERGVSTKALPSKRRLKVNENKMPLLSTKQKQMKRIYNDHDELLLMKMGSNGSKLTRRDQTYYFKSLEKVQSIYNSRNQCRTEERFEDIANSSKQSSFFPKMPTESRYQNSRRRIKDIILRGRRLNKEMIYLRETDPSYPQPNADTISEDPFVEAVQQPQTQQIEISKIQLPPVEIMQKEQIKKEEVAKEQGEITLTQIAAKVEERQAKKGECQLI